MWRSTCFRNLASSATSRVQSTNSLSPLGGVHKSKVLQLRGLSGDASKGGKKKGKKNQKNKKPSKYEATVNLPKTEFPMRASAGTRELENIEDLTSRLYNWQREAREGSQEYILHDGPPYANGDLHTGHFLNKTLKDIICRYHLMTGKRLHYIPGWDTHGLPIELKALQLAGEQFRSSLDAKTIRANAHKCAQNAIDNQRAGIIRWGIIGDWERKDHGWYATMDKSYEDKQLEVFGKMIDRGLVFRGLKPVFWSYSSGTALAEAEIEYSDNHISPSCFVDLPVRELSAEAKGPLTDALGDHVKDLQLTIWTTTPWTLPSNVAVSVHADLEYAVLADARGLSSGPLRFIARDIVDNGLDALEKMYPEGYKIVASIPGKALEGTTYLSPLASDFFGDAEGAPPLPRGLFSVICGKHVTLDAGTGLVHTAPMHGQDDAMVWQSYGYNLLDCPLVIDSKGCFDMSVDSARWLPSQVRNKLEGLHIHEGGNEAVLELLGSFDRLAVPAVNYTHRYPYDWRTKKPIIIMATDQWFVDLTTLKHAAGKALEPVDLVPASSRPRLSSMLEGRDQWCISRQRYWGVPIPALFPMESSNGEPWLDDDVVKASREFIGENGSDWWFSAEDVEEKVAARANELRAEKGLPAVSGPWIRGTDTLDVWFDSGCSWNAVLPPGTQADVYLEGSDQHRGWFQSSLLTRVAATPEGESPVAPFKHIVTHGFILDDQGRKMSKSLGNTIEPGLVISGGKDQKKDPPYGADVLRFWVASGNYVDDVAISPDLIKESSDSLRRVRNVMRFLLGNLYDFDPKTHSLETFADSDLEPLDRYILDRTSRFVEASRTGYEEFKFRSVFSELVRFTNSEVSALYGASIKDRLYNDAADATTRRVCQSVSWEILQALTLVSAPITAFTSQDLYKFAVQEVGPFRGSPENTFAVHQVPFPSPPTSWQLDEAQQATFEKVLLLRQQVNRSLDALRSAQTIRSSEEAELVVKLKDANSDLQAMASTLESMLLLAHCDVSVLDSTSATSELEQLESIPVPEELQEIAEMYLYRTCGVRCERCRRHTAPAEDQLCTRCESVLT